MEVRPPEEPIVWGIQMGLQPKKDGVTGLLESEAWEDDATATTTASTADPTAIDGDMSDNESLEETGDRENTYRELPIDPLCNR